jgi:hypothetical protein
VSRLHSDAQEIGEEVNIHADVICLAMIKVERRVRRCLVDLIDPDCDLVKIFHVQSWEQWDHIAGILKKSGHIHFQSLRLNLGSELACDPCSIQHVVGNGQVLWCLSVHRLVIGILQCASYAKVLANLVIDE